MCVLYVSFGSKVRPITFGCFAMGSVLLFILRSRLLVYSARSGVNREQVVSFDLVYDIVLFCPGTLCRYCCMYLMAVCVDVMVMASAYAMT